jgi:hypothetical protein
MEQANKHLHVLSDGSVLRVITSRDLIAIPVWKGNRVIDTGHVEEIKRAIGSKITQLDFGYRIVTYTTTDAAGAPVKESYIVDGQHRARVLKDYYEENYCVPSFNVVILEKVVESEFDVIEYFNVLNNSKPIKYDDPNIIINRYILELERAFNKSKKCLMIRPKDTRRPYLSVERLREALMANAYRLKGSVQHIQEFVERVKRWNEERVRSADIDALSNTKDGELILQGAKLGFELGVSMKLVWVGECL